MTAPKGAGDLRDAFSETLVELGDRDPHLAVVEADRAAATRSEAFGRRFPARYFDLGPHAATATAVAAGLALSGRVAFVTARAAYAAGDAYAAVRDTVAAPRASVKIVGSPADPLAGPGAPDDAGQDVGAMRGLPGMAVVVPADGPTVRSATYALHDRPGPAYLRLARGRLPPVTDGSFAVGRAAELRAGSDLTLVALGAMVAPALEVAEALGAIGVSVRVLDWASVKPCDEPALLRAARDTGAILVLEEHSVATGVGEMVAATTAENYPVPVRRVGLPDLFGESADPGATRGRYGFGLDRLRDEAWELLRARGKVQ